jgi:hypothetical protein
MASIGFIGMTRTRTPKKLHQLKKVKGNRLSRPYFPKKQENK